MQSNEATVFIDLETTGLNPSKERVCQLALIKVNGGEINTLINPEKPIGKEESKIHGITNDMVKDAPKFHEIADEIIAELELAKIFVAYNYIFDFQFLQNELYLAKNYILDEEEFTFLDPYKIFKKMFPHNLQNAYKFYTGEEMEGAHDAMSDIKATKTVLEQQKLSYPELFAKPSEEIANITLGGQSVIGRWFDKNSAGEYLFKQGKHKGEKFSFEHHKYLEWISSLDDITISEKRVIEKFLSK